MPKYSPNSLITHDMLAAVMPFGTAWLDDGHGNPDMLSVTIASALSLLQLLTPTGALSTSACDVN